MLLSGGWLCVTLRSRGFGLVNMRSMLIWGAIRCVVRWWRWCLFLLVVLRLIHVRRGSFRWSVLLLWSSCYRLVVVVVGVLLRGWIGLRLVDMRVAGWLLRLFLTSRGMML